MDFSVEMSVQIFQMFQERGGHRSVPIGKDQMQELKLRLELRLWGQVAAEWLGLKMAGRERVSRGATS